jgi:hypothetical protein
VTLQAVGVVGSLVISLGALALAGAALRIARRADRRDDEHLAIDRDRREDEIRAQLPKLRIMRRSISQQGRDSTGLSNFSVDAQLDPGPDASEVWLEATYQGQSRRSDRARPIRSGNGDRLHVTVPEDWTENNGQALRPGVVLRLFDEYTGVEDKLMIE